MTERIEKQMNSVFWMVSIFFLVYAAGNYYIGLRFFQSFHSIMEPYALLYWSVYIFLAVSKLVGRIARERLTCAANDIIIIIGDYWLAASYYFFLFWLFIDIGRLLSSIVGMERVLGPSAGLGVLLLTGVLLTYGTWNARKVRVRHYDVTIPKAADDLAKLHAVMVSDVHLGVIVDNCRLEKMVSTINQLQPDIVFFAGDTIDEDVQRFVKKNMPEVLKKINARYGVFAVLGNHEYLGSNSQLAIKYLQQSGITVLKDEYQLLNQQFYIVGRDDPAAVNINGYPRLDLSTVMQGMDKKLPIILLDHQPIQLHEAQLNGVDLQLSGHTHHGQFFPNHYITKRMFEKDWGYLRKDNFQVIVSCGFGTWGPPIRIGNCPEIIDLMIYFENQT